MTHLLNMRMHCDFRFEKDNGIFGSINRKQSGVENMFFFSAFDICIAETSITHCFDV